MNSLNSVEARIDTLVRITQDLTEQLSAQRQGREHAERLLHASEMVVNQHESQALSHHRNGIIAAEALGVGAGLSTSAAGAVLSVAFPPVGIPMLIVGLIGLVTGSVFLGIDGEKEQKIRHVLSTHGEYLTYKQAYEVVERGYIELCDIDRRRFRYTATQRVQI